MLRYLTSVFYGQEEPIDSTAIIETDWVFVEHEEIQEDDEVVVVETTSKNLKWENLLIEHPSMSVYVGGPDPTEKENTTTPQQKPRKPHNKPLEIFLLLPHHHGKEFPHRQPAKPYNRHGGIRMNSKQLARSNVRNDRRRHYQRGGV